VLWITLPLLSCGTATTPGLSPAASAVKAVPCVSLRQLPYHAPDNALDLNEWLAGALADPENTYDTTATVALIRGQNAAIAAVCD
jgi:hypothetical protein